MPATLFAIVLVFVGGGLAVALVVRGPGAPVRDAAARPVARRTALCRAAGVVAAAVLAPTGRPGRRPVESGVLAP